MEGRKETVTIVTHALRNRAAAEEILVEVQCILLDLGHPDLAKLVRRACVLLTTPPPKAPSSNILQFPQAA
jgi:hypothetical protein